VATSTENHDGQWWWWPLGLAVVFAVIALVSFRNPANYSSADVATLTAQPNAQCSYAANGKLLRTGSNKPCKPNESGFGVVVLAAIGGAVLGFVVAGALHLSGSGPKDAAVETG
jgi:hypothetical protein